MVEKYWQVWIKEHANNIWRVAIVLLFLGLAIYAITLNHFGRAIAGSEPWLLLTSGLIDIGPELAGIVIGVVTIDYLNERRQDKQLKEQLIIQMASQHNDVSDTAIRVLSARGWLYDGSLNGANFFRANLEGARLLYANLEGAILEEANLSKADLWSANLKGTNLFRANLSEASFEKTNLSEANLERANLGGATLWRANLSRANLQEAFLNRADLGLADLVGANLLLADLSGANLGLANLMMASLYGANLSGAKLFGGAPDREPGGISIYKEGSARNWTLEQLKQAVLEGAFMPDEVWLRAGEVGDRKAVEGPTFEEWETRYLARQEAERTKRQPGNY